MVCYAVMVVVRRREREGGDAPQRGPYLGGEGAHSLVIWHTLVPLSPKYVTATEHTVQQQWYGSDAAGMTMLSPPARVRRISTRSASLPRSTGRDTGSALPLLCNTKSEAKSVSRTRSVTGEPEPRKAQHTHPGECTAMTELPSRFLHSGQSRPSVILTRRPSRSTSVRSTSSIRAVHTRFSTLRARPLDTLRRMLLPRNTRTSRTVTSGGSRSSAAPVSIHAPCVDSSARAGANSGALGVSAAETCCWLVPSCCFGRRYTLSSVRKMPLLLGSLAL